jgi:hypothetical protein
MIGEILPECPGFISVTVDQYYWQAIIRCLIPTLRDGHPGIMPLLWMFRHTHGSSAKPTHHGPGSTPHRHRTEHTTPPQPAEYPNTPDTPDTPPGNTGPHAQVPESTPHTGPPADTYHAPHPAAPADHTQDSHTGAKTSDD